MRKLWLLPLAIIGVGLLLGAWSALRPAPPEPVYQGKPLSAWLDSYILLSHGDPGEDEAIELSNQQVDDAIRAMGTNAIPTLLRMSTATDSPLRKMEDFLYEHGLSQRTRRTSPSVVGQKIDAAFALRALGPEARDVAPWLIRLYNQDPMFRDFWALALGGIGPSASNAVPLLLQTVTNSATSLVPNNSLAALGEIHTDPNRVVPVLTSLLQSTNPSMRRRTAKALARFGPEAKSALPALIRLLNDTNEWVRQDAATAVEKIDPASAPFLKK